jgi:hypothetical protein
MRRARASNDSGAHTVPCLRSPARCDTRIVGSSAVGLETSGLRLDRSLMVPTNSPLTPEGHVEDIGRALGTGTPLPNDSPMP